MVPAVLRTAPAFRLLLAGQAASVLGDRIAMLALPFAVLGLGGGVGGVALVAACQTAPYLVVGLPAGVWADRHDRRALMLGADALRLVAQALAGALLLAGAAEVWHLAVLAAATGAGGALFSPALPGLLPHAVAREDLREANALLGATQSVGSLAGPALGGVLVAVTSTGAALLADAATYAVSLACLAAVRLPAVARDPAAAAPTLRDGLRVVRELPDVGRGLAVVTGYSFFVLPSVFTLGPALADERYGGAGDWAIISTCFGVGALLGTVVLLRWMRPRRTLAASAACGVLASLQAVAIGSGLPVAAIGALMAVLGVFVTGLWTLWETGVQEEVPEAALSRVSAFDFVLTSGALTAGTAAGGLAATAVGLQPTLVAGGLAGAALALWAVRRAGAPGRASPVPARP